MNRIKTLISPFLRVDVLIFLILIVLFCLFPFQKIHGILQAYDDYLLIYVLLSWFLLSLDSVSPVPSGPLIFMNAVVMGLIPGIILSLVGLVSASCSGYLLGRYFPFRFFKKTDPIKEKLNHNLAIHILVSRGIPGYSELMNFFCGTTRIPLLNFLVLCLAGYIPWCIAFSIMGTIKNEWIIISMLLLISILLSVSGKTWIRKFL